MTKTLIESTPVSPARSAAVARNLERVAWLMDRAFKIPGTKITVGLDALIGLFPGVGDVLTGLVQAGLVVVALYHYKVPKTVAARMAGNVLLDIAVGAIPLLGDLFDVAFKANTRNLRLLAPYRPDYDAHDAPPEDVRPRGTSWRLLLPIALALIAVLTLMIIGLITIVRWLF
jgi:hypothetical protein